MRAKISAHYRFFISPEYPDSRGTVRFSRGESRHMTASLRVSEGDMVSATDGRGSIYRLAVESASGREVVARVVSVEHAEQIGPMVHLFQGVIKPSRMELIVEKATELGLGGFTPVLSARSDAKVGRIRMERLKRAAIEAMKQSLGAYLPYVRDPVGFDEAVDITGDFDFMLIAREGEGAEPLDQVLGGVEKGRVALWVGPAGGFTDDEMTMLAERGAIAFTLGPRRLKSETAAIASLAIIQHILLS